MGYPRAVHYAAALALTAIPVATPAAEYTGNNVLSECPAAASWSNAACFGRVIGALAGFQLKARVDKTTIPFCMGEGVTNGQVVDVVVEWLRKNPEKRHLPFEMVTALAVKEAFPCS